jgi:RNA recognition motif-containing protein
MSKSKMVFVGGLPTKMHEADVWNFFSEFGNIIKVVVVYSDQELRNSEGEIYFGVLLEIGGCFV